MWVPPRSLAIAALFAVASMLLFAQPARAAVTGAASTTTATVTAGTTTTLTGMSVTAGAADSVSVTVSTTVGTLTVDTSTGIVLAYGYAATGAEISFTGSGSQVNAALASIELNAPSGARGSTATVAIVAQDGTGSVVYSADTGHFYEYVASSGISWSDALTAAQSQSYLGQAGYLASVPSSAVNSLITGKIPGALNVWLGGHAIANFGGYARSWQWAAGPLANTEFTRCSNLTDSCAFVDSSGFYYNWSPGEPNNYNNNEPYVVTNWNAPNGLWNDLDNNPGAGIAGYVVEYGDLVYGSTGFTGLFTDSAPVLIAGVPDPPTGVSAVSGLGQATVSFTAPVNDGGAAIDGYRINVSPGGATVSCAASPCTVTGLTGGQSYTFGVQAHNSYGYSTTATSAAVTAGLGPSAPTGFSATPVVGTPYSDSVSSSGYPAPTYSVTAGALPDGLSLDPASGAITGTPTTSGPWSATITATNTYGSNATTFTGTTEAAPTITTASLGTLAWGVPVDFYLSIDGVPTPTASVTAGAMPSGLTLDSDGRVHGTPDATGVYSVTVEATNSRGTDSRVYNGSVDVSAPSSPTITGISEGSGVLSVEFTPPSSNGGGAITTYMYSLDGGSTWLPRDTGTTESPLTITGLTNGTTYSVMVLAVNSAGQGSPSGASTGRPHSATLAATGANIAAIRLAAAFILSGAVLVAIARRRERAWRRSPV